MAIAKKKNQALWNRIKSRIKAGSKGGRPGQWSARKAQLLAKRYKSAGGGYKYPLAFHLRSSMTLNLTNSKYSGIPKSVSLARISKLASA